MLSDAIKKEIFHMAIGIVILTVFMLCIFGILGYLDWTAVYGAILGSAFTFINFVLLGLTVQVASDSSPAKAQRTMGLSYACRFLLTGIIVFIGIKISIFNYVAVVIPLMFPRIVIFTMHLIRRRK